MFGNNVVGACVEAEERRRLEVTYKLNPELRKISSPVVLVIGADRLEYASGNSAAAAEFDKWYLITEMKAVDSKIEISLEEQIAPVTNWNGEEQTFF